MKYIHYVFWITLICRSVDHHHNMQIWTDRQRTVQEPQKLEIINAELFYTNNSTS